MNNDPLYVGLDIGTTGARVIAIDSDGVARAEGRARMDEFGANLRDPQIWWRAAQSAMNSALQKIDKKSIRAICVDGTSGTSLPIDVNGAPLGDASMYNDPCKDAAILETVADFAPESSAAHGATSGLARALAFCQFHRPAKVVHQADWIAGQFSGLWCSDENNALKTGYDPIQARWPNWISKTGMDMELLPEVHVPGTPVGQILPNIATEFGLPKHVLIIAGTTDGCASFIATGARSAGEGVTVLGTSLTLKILSEKPIFSSEYGIYSHKVLGNWLVGGSSNSGGKVLLAHFEQDKLEQLSLQIDLQKKCSLDYYPLAGVGERFPTSDLDLAPKISPRPESDVDFLHELLDGIAGVEALGYARLSELGTPRLSSVRTVGGGAKNSVWTKLRETKLGTPMVRPLSDETAFGSALLARRGAQA